MKKYLIAFASLIVIVSACEKENKESFVSDEFNIHASLDNYTKASDTDFEDDDIIGIFVTENETELTSAGNYGGNGDNLEYTHLSGKWVKNNGPLKWKDSKATTVYGYSPRTTTITSVGNYIFTVSEDQSDKAKYSSADFLWAKHENIAYGSSASLKFAHQLSNIVINLKKDTSIGEITEVTIVNVANECSVNLATGGVSYATTGAPAMVLNEMIKGEKYRAVLAPQIISNKDFIKIKAIVDGSEVEYKYSVTSLTLESGKKYIYTLTLKRSGINVTGNSITDWTGKDEPGENQDAEVGQIPTKPLITSSFIQAYDLIGFGDNIDLINDYLSKLKEADITEVVIDQAIYFSSYQGNEEYLSLVPLERTELENGVTPSSLRMNAGNKFETVLQYCEDNDMKVFVGLYFDSRQWGKTDINQTELTRCMKMGNNMMDKILALYEKKYPNALHGWYFSWEVNNVDMDKQENYAILKGMFDQLLTNINSKLIRRPLLLSPFANEVYGMSAADYGAMWKKLFNECGFKTGDIFAPQDCVGTGKISDANYSTWMNAYADAVASKQGMEFGINVELFKMNNQTHETELFSAGRVKKQLEDAAKYATKILSFSYFYHYCRGDQNNHAEYKNYVNTIP